MKVVDIMLASVRDRDYYPFDDSVTPRKPTQDEVDRMWREASAATDRTRAMRAEWEMAEGVE